MSVQDEQERDVQIVWLDQSGCHDVTLTGGKAATMSRLAADHSIPPGFCVTTRAFEKWKEHGESVIPAEIHRQVAKAYCELVKRSGIEDVSVAVRSSALDEDGASSSFAGMHDTYLNITGIDALVEAMQKCWNSFTGERALSYRRQQRLRVGDSALAILVQQLIHADISGVVFTANPVSGNRQESVINASWGLGECIVNGTVTPDTFIVSNADLSILDTRISDKHVMTVLADQGTSEAAVPTVKRHMPALDEGQIVSIARLALTLQDTMGWCVDVEWAYHSTDLYLLPCRPITTLL